MKTRGVVGTLLFSLVVALGATGCTAVPTGADPSGSPAATSTSSAPPETSEPADSSPEEPAPTCETVFTAEENASLEADGLTPAEEVHPLGATMQAMIDAGALACLWTKPQGDVAVWYAALPVDAAAQAQWSADLAATGYTQTDDPIAGTLLAPVDYDANYQPVVVFHDGTMHFASYPMILGSVVALQ